MKKSDRKVNKITSILVKNHFHPKASKRLHYVKEMVIWYREFGFTKLGLFTDVKFHLVLGTTDFKDKKYSLICWN